MMATMVFVALADSGNLFTVTVFAALFPIVLTDGILHLIQEPEIPRMKKCAHVVDTPSSLMPL